jgi:hypothetical protein
VAKWFALSPEHKASAAVPLSYARYIVSKIAGRKAAIRPTGLADWQALGDAFKDAAFKRACEESYAHFRAIVEGLQSPPKP